MAAFEVMKEYIVINSGDRDFDRYPSASKYKISLFDFGISLKNTVSISLHMAILPEHSCVKSQPFILLNIPELGGKTFQSTNQTAHNAFAMLQVDRGVGNGFINVKPDSSKGVILRVKDFEQPSLQSLTIELLTLQGCPLVFDDEASPKNQHTLMFEIVKKVN